MSDNPFSVWERHDGYWYCIRYSRTAGRRGDVLIHQTFNWPEARMLCFLGNTPKNVRRALMLDLYREIAVY